MTPYEEGYEAGMHTPGRFNPYGNLDPRYDEWTRGYMDGWRAVPGRGPVEIQL